MQTTERHRQPSADLGAKSPLLDVLAFFFFPVDFCGLAGLGVSSLSTKLMRLRCGGGVDGLLCGGGVVMLRPDCDGADGWDRRDLVEVVEVVDAAAREVWGASYPCTLSLDRHWGHTTTPRVSANCSAENSTRFPQLGQFQFIFRGGASDSSYGSVLGSWFLVLVFYFAVCYAS